MCIPWHPISIRTCWFVPINSELCYLYLRFHCCHNNYIDECPNGSARGFQVCKLLVVVCKPFANDEHHECTWVGSLHVNVKWASCNIFGNCLCSCCADTQISCRSHPLRYSQCCKLSLQLPHDHMCMHALGSGAGLGGTLFTWGQYSLWQHHYWGVRFFKHCTLHLGVILFQRSWQGKLSF